MPISTTPTLISARTAGAIYLAVIGLGMFGEVFVRGSLVVSGNATATASNILGSEVLWRIGIATDLLMHVLDVPLIVFFYLLLKRVSYPLALLATTFNVVQTCVLVLNKIFLVSALPLLNSLAFSAGQIDTRPFVLFAVGLHSQGFGLGLIFFGLTCVIRGYLIFVSGFVPRLFGVLLGLAGLSYLVNSFALLLSPQLAASLFPAVLLPAFVGELAISLWLLVAKEEVLQQQLAKAPSATAAAD